jgi:hypothetical protein
MRGFGEKNSIYLKPLKKCLHGEIVLIRFVLRIYLKNISSYHH